MCAAGEDEAQGLLVVERSAGDEQRSASRIAPAESPLAAAACVRAFKDETHPPLAGRPEPTSHGGQRFAPGALLLACREDAQDGAAQLGVRESL